MRWRSELRLFLIIVGALQMAGGVLAFLGSKSAIHEILGSVSFGLGAVCIGLVMVVMEIEKLAQTK